MPRSRSQAPAAPSAGISVMVSEYQLHWKAIYWKSKLQTLLECSRTGWEQSSQQSNTLFQMQDQPWVLKQKVSPKPGCSGAVAPEVTQVWPGGADKEWASTDGHTGTSWLPPGHCPSSAAFQTEEAPAAWLEERTLQATLSCGKWLRPLLCTHFHTWLETKKIKYPWICRQCCIEITSSLFRQGQTNVGKIVVL